MSLRLEDALPEKRAARRAFARARNFDEACFVHDEARARLLERCGVLRLDPRVVVDLGCATGRTANGLATQYPRARVLAIDSGEGMLRMAARGVSSAVALVGGDAEQLPLEDSSVELVLANLLLPWCRPERVFAEAARVLKEGGAFMFTTLGPATLEEVRLAFAAADERLHVHAAFDLQALGDFAMAAGLAEPVLDVDRVTVTYPDIATLVRDLRAAGAVNVAPARRKTLTGRARWRRFEQAIGARGQARLAVTVELILGLAWGRGAQRRGRGARSTEIAIPVERIGRAAENR